MKTYQDLVAEVRNNLINADLNGVEVVQSDANRFVARFNMPGVNAKRLTVTTNAFAVRITQLYSGSPLAIYYDSEFLRLANWTIEDGVFQMAFDYSVPAKYRWERVDPLEGAAFNEVYFGVFGGRE